MKLLLWCGLGQAFIFEIFFSPTTHTSVISLLSTASSEHWGSEEHNWEGPVLWSSFFVATTAHSGSLGNGQCSELVCLDGADTQLCGVRNKCFYGFGKQRLILGFDMPVVSFIDYCSLWSLRIILGAINQSLGGGGDTHFFFLHCSLYSIPPSHFFLTEAGGCVCLHRLWICNMMMSLEPAVLAADVCRQKGLLRGCPREALLQERH